MRRSALLLLLALASLGAANKRVRRQNNLYSVSDFLGQLGQLAVQSQGGGGGGTPGNYLAGLLQGYQQSSQAGYRPQYQQGYRPPRPVPPEYLQDLQYQQQYQQGQSSLGYDTVNGAFGQRPGGAGLGGVLAGPGGLGGALGPLGGLAGLLGGGQGGYPYPQRPGGQPGVSLANALQSVARYDDAQCVPRLLCELTAGGRPGGAKQNEALPFVNRDTLLSLLTVLNFGTGSPLLVFGRAALLGYMAQGDPNSCYTAYPACPRDADRLVDYLNNHNGGFFRFFTGVGNPQYLQQQGYPTQYPGQGYPGQGNPGQGYPGQGYPGQGYPSGQGYQGYPSSQGYQGYPGGGGYAPQYRDFESHSSKPFAFPDAKKRSLPMAESRILTKVHPEDAAASPGPFLPTPRPPSGYRDGRQDHRFSAPSSTPTSGVTVVINGQHVPIDPSTLNLAAGQYTFSNPYQQTGSKVYSYGDAAQEPYRPYIPNIRLEKPVVPVEIFPTRTGTGDLRLDLDEHLKLAAQGRPQAKPQAKPFRFASGDEGRYQDYQQASQQNYQQNYQQDYQQNYQQNYQQSYQSNRVGKGLRFPQL